ncbi:MAG TPA: hypothetical protein VI757_05215 [Bacteroidia bacterium]|nr:hypothetical protein [Bacteroidia bacterium]
MLAKLFRRFPGITFIFIYTFLFITACTCNPPDPDVSSVQIDKTILRFDSDLTAHVSDIGFIREKYANFFNRYINDITRISRDSATLSADLQRFVTDSDFIEVNRAVQEAFKNISETETKIVDALRHYKYYFPQKKIPDLITFVSLFNYAVISTDSVLGIGLDMYLGSESKYYASLGFPEYKIQHMRKEYISLDAMRGWLESEFPFDEGKHNFLSHLIYKGKILYALDAMFPKLSDTLKTGYSASQFDWCYENEKNIWSFFIDQKLLFSNSVEQYSKYISEGPTTNGFPKESPGNIAAFTGWQIVKSYMKENSDVSLEKLMNENDATVILKDSKYKPKK